jgi:tetracycline 7-halogenase / FADH2 O2-dependent halogenase
MRFERAWGSRKMVAKPQYDVMILGSGLGGAMLAAILAKGGLSVLLLEAEIHPRFTIGEATTPDTNFRLKLLGVKYDVPEISYLSSFHELRDHVGPSSGAKRAFSFLYHHEGRDQNPLESHQYPTLAPPMGPDCHFFRQDTDAYMMATAARYGAKVRQLTRITEFEIEDEIVKLVSNKGEVFTGSYLVDGTGMKSVLAGRFNLRDDPNSYLTNSRAIFTHMVDVEHYDTVGRPHEEYGLKYPLSQSTLHHIFDGGWMWVIPFNNHADAVNPLCSVGLLLDREKHPETGMDPEEEFFSYVRRFPAVSKQFAKAKAVRNWNATARIQYGCTQLTGHRYCLLSHAAGFIDPLFSSGLVLTTATVDLIAQQLFRSFETNDFSVENYQHINEYFQTNARFFDRVVGNSFLSFQDYDLWDAWFRVWVVGLLIGTELNGKLFVRYLETGDKAILDASPQGSHSGVLGSDYKPFRELFERASAEMDRVRTGADPKMAAARIREMFRGLDYVPTYFRWHDAAVRTTPAFTVGGMTRMYFWYRLRSPRPVFEELYGWKPLTAYGYIFSSILKNIGLARRRRRGYIRDVFQAWNNEWTEPEQLPRSAAPEARAPLPQIQVTSVGK